MKPSTQCSSNRRSKVEAQLKRKPQQMISKSLIADFNSADQESKEIDSKSVITDFNTAELEVSEVQFQNSPDSTAAWGVTPESDEKFETIQSSPISAIDSTLTIVDSTNSKIGEGEAQLVVDFLREARSRISEAVNVDHRSKKIVEAVIDVMMDDCFRSAARDGRCYELMSLKVRIAVFCFFTWIVLVLILFLCNSGDATHHPDPLPT